MNYRRLGKTGLKVSELSYGSWVTFSFQVGLDEAVNIMELAYENGVNFLIMQRHMHLENLKLLWAKL